MEDYCLSIALFPTVGRATTSWASRKSSSREASASTTLSTDRKMLGESTTSVNRAEGDLSANDAFIANFMAVDCFIFLTGVLYFRAIGRG